MAKAIATCIYCRKGSDEVPFNREHVLPEAFGRFRGALTLHNTVCQPCNSYFADTVDRELSRKGVEGLERYRWGVKKPEEIAKFSFEHVKLRTLEEGDFKGTAAQLYHEEEIGELRARPLPFVAIRNQNGDEFTHFTPEEVLDGTWKARAAATNWRRGIKVFGPDALVETLLEKLRVEGVQPKEFRPLVPPPSPDVEFEQEFSVTPAMKRGLAKIAVNYLAKRCGGEFALRSDFDTIRDYVRYGTEGPLPAVRSKWDLPFKTNAPDGMRPVIHWLGLTGHASHRNLLGEVVLFGFMTHIVMHASNFVGPWPDLPLAHIYNTKTLAVSEAIPRKPRWRHANSVAPAS